jgi:hypothetical protein
MFYTNPVISYIPDLNPMHIRVLAETASSGQVETLRDTIFKYIMLKTSIRVKIPVRFHIWFLETRALML